MAISSQSGQTITIWLTSWQSWNWTVVSNGGWLTWQAITSILSMSWATRTTLLTPWAMCQLLRSVGHRPLAEPYAGLISAAKHMWSILVQDTFSSSRGCVKLSPSPKLSSPHAHSVYCIRWCVCCLGVSHWVGCWVKGFCCWCFAALTSVDLTWPKHLTCRHWKRALW